MKWKNAIKLICIIMVLTQLNIAAAVDVPCYSDGVISKVNVTGVLLGEHKKVPVSVVIYKEATEGEGVTNENIKHIYQISPDEQGNWEVTFATKENVSEYKILLRQNGVLKEPKIRNITAVSDAIDVKHISDVAKNAINTKVVFDNPFGLEVDVMTFVAQYDKDGVLIGIDKIDTSLREEDTEKQLEFSYKKDAEYAKIFTWCTEDLTPMTDVRMIEPYINYRGSVGNIFTKLENNEPVTIAYFGGSVTWGAGASSANNTSWRAITENWFREKYPNAEITAINSAIGDTGSFFGTMRLERDVIAHEPDMIFMMFSINDVYCSESQDSTQRQMEEIIKTIREKLPETDIIMEYDIDISKANYGTYGEKKYSNSTYLMRDWHEEVAEKYGITTVNFGEYLADKIRAEKPEVETDAYVWDKYFSDIVHPKDAGHSAYAELMIKALETACTKKKDSCVAYEIPAGRQFEMSMNPKMYDAGSEGFSVNGQTLVKKGLSGAGAYTDAYRLASGDEMTVTFEGKNVGVLKAREASATGTYSFSIDGKVVNNLSPTDRAPAKVATNLTAGRHTMVIKNNSNTDAYFYAIFTWE